MRRGDRWWIACRKRVLEGFIEQPVPMPVALFVLPRCRGAGDCGGGAAREVWRRFREHGSSSSTHRVSDNDHRRKDDDQRGSERPTGDLVASRHDKWRTLRFHFSFLSQLPVDFLSWMTPQVASKVLTRTAESAV